jgi:hypothetical protein
MFKCSEDIIFEYMKEKIVCCSMVRRHHIALIVSQQEKLFLC